MIEVRARIRSAVTDEEAAELASIAKDRIALECGSHFGFSTIVIGRVAKRLVAVDWHYGDDHSGHGVDSLAEYFDNLTHFGLREKVVSVVGRFEDVLPMLERKSFEVAFLDGFHEFEAVKRDVLMVLPLLVEGGLLAFHDYGPSHFGVKRAVDILFPGTQVKRVGNLATVSV